MSCPLKPSANSIHLEFLSKTQRKTVIWRFCLNSLPTADDFHMHLKTFFISFVAAAEIKSPPYQI